MVDTTIALRLPEVVRSVLVGGPRLNRRRRKIALVAHILIIGLWLGTAFSLLVLASFGRFADDHRTVHGTYLVFDFFDVWIMPTLGALTLCTGFTLAIGTNYGVLTRRWVLAKIVLAGIVLLTAWRLMQPWVREASEVTSFEAEADLAGLDTRILGFALAFNLALWFIVVVSITKPWGLTRFGQSLRQRSEPR